MRNSKWLGAAALLASTGLMATHGAAQDNATKADQLRTGSSIVVLRTEGSLTHFLHSNGDRVRYCQLSENYRASRSNIYCSNWQ